MKEEVFVVLVRWEIPTRSVLVSPFGNRFSSATSRIYRPWTPPCKRQTCDNSVLFVVKMRHSRSIHYIARSPGLHSRFEFVSFDFRAILIDGAEAIRQR